MSRTQLITPNTGIILDNTAQSLSRRPFRPRTLTTGNSLFLYYIIKDHALSEVDYEATLTSAAAVKNDKMYNPNEYTTTGITRVDLEIRINQIRLREADVANKVTAKFIETAMVNMKTQAKNFLISLAYTFPLHSLGEAHLTFWLVESDHHTIQYGIPCPRSLGPHCYHPNYAVQS
ncbi:hypothetical protein DYB37_009257 [Aphanomyces astaci]|uniref:Uncharacterized protein n=1 Tax=Aphanomyces astaci TaxID=112090 RepID=A0A3R6WDC9_APHAT|nr:hypothetical protein DYB35_009915 [Aphanomyces astaci]RHZ15348.1 hypothetical protein DYB37_009257 [Aphanomyces astaci]